MAYDLKITHFSVGQGLCVLIHLQRDVPNTFLGLLDMGTLSNQRIYAADAITSIQSVINSNSGVLDYVHISHLDSDHYNLFKKLSITSIKKLVIGGNNTKVSVGSIFSQGCRLVKTYKLNTYTKFPAQNPYMRSTRDLDTEVDLENNIFFRINTLIYRADLVQLIDNNSSLKINTGSSIVLVSVVHDDGTTIEPGISYLFTGDSTCYTLAQFNKENYQFNTGLDDRIVLIPHHGTERNMIEDNTHLQSFLEQYSPLTAVVSAKCMRKQGWAHPAKAIIDIYSDIVHENEDHLFTSFEVKQGNIIEVVAEKIMSNISCTFTLPETCNGLNYKKNMDLAKKELNNDFSGDYPNVEFNFSNS